MYAYIGITVIREIKILVYLVLPGHEASIS